MSQRRRQLRSALAGIGGVTVVAAALGAVAGLPGLGVAAVVGAVWWFASPVYAVGVGGLLYATLVMGAVTGVLEAAAAASLAALFAADLLVRWPVREAFVAVVALVAATAGLGAAWMLEPLVLAAATPVVAFALLAYALHRYELVRLGLLEEAGS